MFQLGTVSKSFMKDMNNIEHNVKQFNTYRLRNIEYLAKQTIEDSEIMNTLPSTDKFYMYDKEVKSYSQSEIRCFLHLHGYICNVGAYYDFWERTEWSTEEKDYEKTLFQDKKRDRNRQPFREGWKFHVALDTYADYLFTVIHVLPEIRNLQLNHKIVCSDVWRNLNNGSIEPLQTGKNLTIYITPILMYKLKELSNEIKLFLSEKTNINIITDKHIGGRVFLRYSGFFDDEVYDPFKNERVSFHRQEGIYKPDWIEEPLILSKILY